MLPATQEEIEHVTEYMRSQAPDLIVEFVQKVYSENVLHVRHDVWDVHTNADRWWIITAPMNLYSQEQFPNMDLALTFHVGLCLRIPRSERQKLSEIPAEPFTACMRGLQEASEALAQAQELADYQSIADGHALDGDGRTSEEGRPEGVGGSHLQRRPLRRTTPVQAPSL